MSRLVERFKSYIAIDTMSNPKSQTVPSSPNQMILAKQLYEELKELGLKARMDDKGYVYGELPANSDKPFYSIGFVAHMDTSPALDGACTNPQIVEYKGGDIKLNEEFSIKVSEFPYLETLVGKTIITTDVAPREGRVD